MNLPNGPQRGESLGLDQLLLRLYRGVGGGTPWSEFLEALCDQLQVEAATLTLRQRARGERGQWFAVGGGPELPAGPFADDPFLALEAGIACSIADRVDGNALLGTEFHRHFFERGGALDMLALNIDFGQGYHAQLRMQRRHGREFGILEKSLLMRLYPHLSSALESFETARRLQLENTAYIGAIDQLAFGVIIVNERGQVARVNETASIIMKESQLLRVVGHYLNAVDPDHEMQVASTVRALLGTRSAAPAEPLKALKLVSRRHAKSLYLLFKAIGGEGRAAPAGLALFLSHDSLQRSISIETFAGLYQLTRAEVALVTELLDGVSIIEASASLGISENTARAQLRSVFGKTGTHRQADLIRLAFTSLAIIA
jgi:DNA-binding CsgD family transcriptional regulator